MREPNGDPLDATEVVARYLQTLPDQTVNPPLNRIQLPAPLRGAQP